AGDFQDTFLARLHHVFVADPDNRIDFHVPSPKCPSPRDTSSCRDRSVEISSPCSLVYCALTGKTREIHFAAIANGTGFVSASEHSKSARHPDVARLKTQALVEPLRIDTGVVREQLDQLATSRLGFRDRPLHQLLADAAAATVPGHANILDQRARCALRTQSWQYAELQASDDGAALLGNDELDI